MVYQTKNTRKKNWTNSITLQCRFNVFLFFFPCFLLFFIFLHKRVYDIEQSKKNFNFILNCHVQGWKKMKNSLLGWTCCWMNIESRKLNIFLLFFSFSLSFSMRGELIGTLTQRMQLFNVIISHNLGTSFDFKSWVNNIHNELPKMAISIIVIAIIWN